MSVATVAPDSGVVVAVGSRLKDNDPRVTFNRVLTVTQVLPNGVLAKDAKGRVFSLLRKRLHTDGKPRRNGFTVLPGGADDRGAV